MLRSKKPWAFVPKTVTANWNPSTVSVSPSCLGFIFSWKNFVVDVKLLKGFSFIFSWRNSTSISVDIDFEEILQIYGR